MKFIGIDLGHGETSAAYVSDSENKVKRLEVSLYKDLVIPTQVMLTYEQMQKLKGITSPDHALLTELGEIKIGNLPTNSGGCERFAYFKKPPKDFNEIPETAKAFGVTCGALMACFIHALVNNILEANKIDLGIEDNSELDLLVGCPSTADWTSDEAVQKYEELIKRAVNADSVTVVPESRAAMYSSIENSSGVISTVNGVAVFDFGSSTADCTYMLLGRAMREFSWALGASQVEMNMCSRVYAEAAEDGNFETDGESLFSVENLLKTAKENYYKGVGSPTIVCSFRDKKSGKKINRIVEIDKDFIDKAVAEDRFDVRCKSTYTKNGSYQSLCRDYFNEARTDFENEQLPVKEIVLTGGASKMDFVKPICEEVFPNAYIHMESNPSYTVSNGLGWVGLTDRKIPDMIIGAEEYVQSESAGRNCSIYHLREGLKDRLFEYIVPIIISCAEKWSTTGGDNLSVEDLRVMINKSVPEDEIKNIFSSEEEQWRHRLMELIGEAVNIQIRELYPENVSKELMLPENVWNDFISCSKNIPGFNAEEFLEKLNIQKILLSVLSGLSTALGIVMIISIFINPVIGLAALLGDLIVNKTAEKQSDTSEMKKKFAEPIPMKKREKKFQELKKCLRTKNEDVKQKLMKYIDEEFIKIQEEYPQSLHDMLSLAFDVVTMKYFEKKTVDTD